MSNPPGHRSRFDARVCLTQQMNSTHENGANSPRNQPDSQVVNPYMVSHCSQTQVEAFQGKKSFYVNKEHLGPTRQPHQILRQSLRPTAHRAGKRPRANTTGPGQSDHVPLQAKDQCMPIESLSNPEQVLGFCRFRLISASPRLFKHLKTK